MGWQCRIRQYAIRHDGGRPSTGMRPTVNLAVSADVTSQQINTLIIKRDPETITKQFRHMVLKTNDPADRYDSALHFLAAAYYQRPHEFSDELTALFARNTTLAGALVTTGNCGLEFRQSNQTYRLPCRVWNLPTHHSAFQATYWHNRLFNAAMPSDVRVLGFAPDWRRAQADPPIV